MRRVALNLSIVATIYLFFIFWARLNCTYLIALFLLLLGFLIVEIYSYRALFRVVVSRAFFKKGGVLRALFSGKLFSFVSSFFYASLLLFSFIFTMMFITKLEFVLFGLLLPPFFLLVRRAFFALFKNELNYNQNLKRVSIYFCSFVASFVYTAVALFFLNGAESEFFAFLVGENLCSANCSLINEIYSSVFYLKRAILWLEQNFFIEHKLLLFLIFGLNNFLFFVAIFHLISLFFGGKGLNLGYFLTTIFTLFYATSLFMVVSFTKEIAPSGTVSKTKEFVEIVVQNSKFKIEKSELLSLLNYQKESKERHKEKLKRDLDNYIDLIYENSSTIFANKLAEFKYSVFSDYLVLWHGVFDNEDFVEKRVEELLKESFPKSFTQGLDGAINRELSSYEREIYDKLSLNLSNLELNLSNIAYSNRQRVGISGSFGAGIGAMLVAKSLAKTGGKAAFSSSSAAVGAVCGPAAVICIPAIAIGSWFGFDYIFAKGDEFLNKDSFIKEVKEELMSQKDGFKRELYMKIDELFDEVDKSIFIIDE